MRYGFVCKAYNIIYKTSVQQRNPTMPRKTIYILIWLFSLGLSINAGRTIWELWKRKDVVSDREAELSHIKQENRSLEATLKDIQSETYLERIARDKLGMVKEGETMIIMPQESKVDSQKSLVGRRKNRITIERYKILLMFFTFIILY